jgi:cell wall-associated NlpC family hydrolase
MRNLFFVSVAIGIFSGTSITVKAQSGTTSVKFVPVTKKEPKFLDDIEVKREITEDEEVDVWAIPSKKNAEKTANKNSIKNTTANTANANIEASLSLQFKYAQLTKTQVENISNIKLYTVIEEWWATKYVYGGTGKRGIDCSALTGTILKQAYNLIVPRTAREQYAAAEKINRAEMRERDLAFFNTTGGVSHVGFYIGNGYFVHASVHSGVTINNLDDDYYHKKFIGGGRLVK